MAVEDIATASYADPVTPSDTVNFTKACRAIYVGTGGDVSVVMAGDGQTRVHKNVPAGGELRVRALRVNVTGTTASDMMAWR